MPPFIISTNPSTSDMVNGVKFHKDKGQMVSEEVDEETADHFARIPGYKKHNKTGGAGGKKGTKKGDKTGDQTNDDDPALPLSPPDGDATVAGGEPDVTGSGNSGDQPE